jgi:putative spermidine/putrescine transport system substrate-binding protein
MRARKSTYLASAVVLVTAMALTGCTAPNSGPAAPAATNASDVPKKPSAPVTLNILDVAGNQKLTGPMVDAFIKDNPDVISAVTWESAGAPDLVGTIKPQVDSGSLSIDLVMTGTASPPASGRISGSRSSTTTATASPTRATTSSRQPTCRSSPRASVS